MSEVRCHLRQASGGARGIFWSGTEEAGGTPESSGTPEPGGGFFWVHGAIGSRQDSGTPVTAPATGPIQVRSP